MTEVLMSKTINGIQQLGIGVENVTEAFAWYRKYFGMDIQVFEEAAVAELMLAHTDGQPRKRHAILALNMQGGGGFEIWQHTEKKPQKPKFEIQLGDLGIAVGKMKTLDIQKTYDFFKSENLDLLTSINDDPSGNKHFYIKDIYGNIWEFKNAPYVFRKDKALNGGVYGATIGVKNMEESLKVYQDILKYDEVVYDKTGTFDDWNGVAGCNNEFRRVLLHHSQERKGAFSPLFGPSTIELIQVVDREPKDIFENRIWGDPGFIHLCYDINGMDLLREEVKEKGFPFTVDSAKANDTFDMGEAAGSFSYIQAPEGTLIEFVETHKVPLLKKIGWSLNLRKRKIKPLPRWMLGLFRFKKVKD